MASSTKSNNNEVSGFKTVAFGFDKNDVTLYIAALRKKMKAMEEEFEEKLSNALENPAVSNEALKHEREVIHSEIEKQFNSKLAERTSIIKRQQEQIEKLENKVSESREAIESLRTQLFAATSGQDSEEQVGAKAAKAYVQCTAELRSIVESAQKALNKIERTWSGELDKAEIEKAKSQTESSVPEAAMDNANDDAVEATKENIAETVNENIVEAVKENDAVNPETDYKVDLSEIIADYPDDSNEFDEFAALGVVSLDTEKSGSKPYTAKIDTSEFDSIIADDDDSASAAENKESNISSISADDDFSSLLENEPEEVKPAKPVKPNDISDDLASLLADDDDDADISAAAPAAVKGDDLDLSLLTDIVIDPQDNATSGDLNQMLEEHERNEFAGLENLLVSPTDPDVERKVKIDSNFTVESLEPDPNIVVEELKHDSKNSANIPPDILAEDEPPKAAKASSDDVFDFSMLSNGSDEEDDMSTNADFDLL